MILHRAQQSNYKNDVLQAEEGGKEGYNHPNTDENKPQIPCVCSSPIQLMYIIMDRQKRNY